MKNIKQFFTPNTIRTLYALLCAALILTGYSLLQPNSPQTLQTAHAQASGQFIKGINMNGPAVSIEGNQWTGYSQALGSGLSVQSASLFAGNFSSPITPMPDTDTKTMLDSTIYRGNVANGQGFTVTQVINNGKYDVYLWTLENYTSNFRDIDVNIEGVRVATAIGDMPLGSWKKHGPYSADVRDGSLTIDMLRHSKGDPILMGMAIYKTSGASVTLVKSADKTSGPIGSTIRYTITYKNDGLEQATQAVITDSIPYGTTYVDDSASNAAQINENYQKLQWNLETINPGQSDSVSFDVTISNVSPIPPTLSIETTTPSITESSGSVTGFTIRRDSQLDRALDVQVSFTGTATSGSDYIPVTIPVTFQKNQSETTIPVSVINDTEFESNETLTATLVAQPLYALAPISNASLTIQSDDAAPPSPSPIASSGSIRVSDNGRYLVKKDGSPFFWVGDTGWDLLQHLNREETDKYLVDRAAKKFNVIQAVAIKLHQSLSYPNAYGQPAVFNNDPRQPNEQYWQHVDYVVNKANSLGLYMAILPVWGDSYAKSLPFSDPNTMRAWGQFLGNRYKDKDIIWVLGGDIEAPNMDWLWQPLSEGITAGGGAQIKTFHPRGEYSSSVWYHNASWLNFHMNQSGHAMMNNPKSYTLTTEEYNRTPARPVLDGEANYENHPVAWNPLNPRFTDFDIRKTAYWSVFAGAAGYTYGANDVWGFYKGGNPGPFYFNTHWETAINFPGASDVQHLKRLMESRPYLTRVPDQTVLASAEGTGGDHLQATRDSNGTYAFVYSPSGIGFTVNMNKITGVNVKASWFNPREGTTSTIGTFSNTGTRSFTPPSSGNGNDWILILDDAAKNFANP